MGFLARLTRMLYRWARISNSARVWSSGAPKKGLRHEVNCAVRAATLSPSPLPPAWRRGLGQFCGIAGHCWRGKGNCCGRLRGWPSHAPPRRH